MKQIRDVSPKQLETIERYVHQRESSESYVEREVERLKRAILRPHKFKHKFWQVEGNWTTSRLHWEMDNPDANMEIMGFFLTQKDAFDAVDKSLNPRWRLNPIERIEIEWKYVRIDPDGFYHEYRAYWTEACEGDLNMRCQARIRLRSIGYLKE